MNGLRRLHLPPLGVVGLLVGGLLRVFAYIFELPVGLVLFSEIILLIAIAWILMFDLFPIFLEPFYLIRKRFSQRRSFFFALLGFFGLMQITTYFLPSGPTKDMTTSLAFLSFAGAIVWFLIIYLLDTFTPLARLMKRKPREVERVTFADVVTSMAIIIAPTVFLSFLFAPPGLKNVEVTPYQVFLSSVLTNVFMAAYLYLYVVRPKLFTWRQLGLRKVDREDAGHAAVAFLFVGALVVIIQALLIRLGVPLNQYSFTSREGAYFALLPTIIITPFVEELYFRGFLFRGLLLHNSSWIAYVSSALLFAVLHPPLIVMAEVFVIGLLLAYLVKETKSIWPGVIIHTINNALVFWFLLYR